MSEEMIHGPARALTMEGEQVDDYFGVCPTCHRTNGFINVGSGHWYFCSEHKTAWCIGSNLFSCWRDETPEQQKAEYDRLGFGEYEEVRPCGPQHFCAALKGEPLNAAAAEMLEQGFGPDRNNWPFQVLERKGVLRLRENLLDVVTAPKEGK